MKNIYSNMRWLYSTVLSTLLLLVLSTNATAQEVVKAFTQRTSTHAQTDYIKPGSGGKIYNLRGDFKMAGNTNLMLTNYTDDGSNNTDMSYVDIDLDGTTINSSSSFLDITNDACTEIVYAGLYWSGRANTGSQTFDATNSNVANGIANNASNETLYHNNPNNGYYNVEIIRQSTSCGFLCTTYNPLYRFNFEGTVIEFNFTNSGDNSAVQYRYGTSGTWIPIAGTYTSGTAAGGTYRGRFTFSTPFLVSVNGREYKINYLNRDSRTGRTQNQYRDTSYGYAQVNLKKITTISVTKNLDKRVVRLKKEGGTYQTITANASNILYPNNGNYNDIYAAYADVTEYIRTNKGGNYFVANLATTAGDDPGATGYYGGWGLVVVYANPTMKWRDITVFDGYAYMQGNNYEEFSLSGFQAAQNGAVNITMGMMAGEGDRSIPGDNFKIQTGTSTNWTDLSHSGNTTNNFFNSSIQVDGLRNPSLVNNTGIDIAKFDVPNPNNSIIGNGQTSTKFRYGSDGNNGGGNNRDTYVIYNVVFAVDAYVPETEVLSQITPTAGVDINNLQPNDEVTLTADIFNYGSDAISNGNLQITIPAGMQLVSTSVHTNTQAGSGANASYSFNSPTWINPTGGSNAIPAATLGGILEWELGNVPTQNLVNGNKVPLATLTYTLKVTDNCLILMTSEENCALRPQINGEITGIGVNSGNPFSGTFIKAYDSDCNNTPIYGGLEMKINPSETFLNACSTSNPVVNDIRMFKGFCVATGGAIPRAEVIGVAPYNYPEGTVFYDESGVVITGDFPIDPLGNIIMYRAVLPGSPLSCYLKLATQLDVITQSPSISNVDVCFGTGFTLNPTATGQDPATSFYYFNDGSATQLAAAPQPNKPGVYTYQVALGKVEGVNYCFGPKTTFTITIRNCKTPVNPMIHTPLNR